MKATDIEWTGRVLPDGTWQRGFSTNPLQYRNAEGKVVWACVKVSPGCANCYSEAIALRFERGKVFNRASMADLTPFMNRAELRKIITAKTVDGIEVSGSRCFPFDMTDVFGEWVTDEHLDEAFAAFALRHDVTFQVLTKRPERAAEYFNSPHLHNRLELAAERIMPGKGHPCFNGKKYLLPRSPLPNVWIGTSVENQAAAGERIPHLLKVPAAVRFLSCEPLLGPVDLDVGRTIGGDPDFISEEDNALGSVLGGIEGIDWVIVGGESGKSSRECHLESVRAIVEQCRSANVPVFVKQLGSVPVGSLVKGSTGGLRIRLPSYKGGNMAEWPSDLRVREFPVEAAA